MSQELDFCKVSFKTNCAICVVNDGETITIEKNKRLTSYVLNHFKDQPFVFITNRVNSFAVDPMIYVDASNVDTLLAVGVVTSHFGSLQSCKVEKIFCTKPFETFYKLENAINWANKIVDDAYPNNSLGSMAS